MIQEVKIKDIRVSGDDRGDFREVLKLSDNLTKKIAQVSIGTTHPGLIKAFHWHTSQDDVFYVLSGNIQLVLYDGRDNSKTKGETQVLRLGESYKPQAVYIPRGVYHGYKIIGDKDARVLYIMNNEYNPSQPDEQRVDFDDKKIGFDWRDKVLVIGAGGFLGKQLMKDLSKSFQVIGASYPEKGTGIYLDITNRKQVKDVLEKEDPDIVILTAAKTNVEECESDPKGTFKTNVSGVKNIVENLSYQKLVFFSTDSVFDGKKDRYKEDDLPHAINVYGQSKLEAEKVVSSYSNHLICRTSRLYGPKGNKFLNMLIETLQKGKKVDVPVDTPGNFSLLEDVSVATAQLIEMGKKGIYHVAGKDINTFAQAAYKAADIFEFKKSLINKVDKDYFNTKVKRPNSPLNIEKLKSEGIKMGSLEDGLIKIKNNSSK